MLGAAEIGQVLKAGKTGSTPEDLHRLRVRVKRLRYGLEILRTLGDKSVRRLLEKLERLQDVLGEGQDAVTQIAWLRRYAAATDPPVTSLLPVGALIQALAKRAAKRRTRALRAWTKLHRSGLLDDVARELHHKRSPSPVPAPRAVGT